MPNRIVRGAAIVLAAPPRDSLPLRRDVMSSSMARDGRRRRVLTEEVRTASLLFSSYDASEDPAAEAAPRYGEQAHIENHPQITDYVPRRGRGLAAPLACGALAAVVSQAIVAGAEPLAGALPGTAVEDLRDRVAGGIAAWSMAAMLLVGAAAARIVFNLRRHRVDDYRGRYRVWKWASWACLALSFNAIVRLHALAGSALAGLLGSADSSGLFWGAATLALATGWIGALATRDVAESRGSVTAACLAWLCGVASLLAASAAQAAPPASWQACMAGVLPIATVSFGLSALTLYARYVVLDVQGLIDHPRKETGTVDRPTEAATSSTPEFAAAAPIRGAVAEAARSGLAARGSQSAARHADDDATHLAVCPATDGSWIDGSEPEVGEEDEEGMPLSKADRKRLRKQKVRRHAA